MVLTSLCVCVFLSQSVCVGECVCVCDTSYDPDRKAPVTASKCTRCAEGLPVWLLH